MQETEVEYRILSFRKNIQYVDSIMQHSKTYCTVLSTYMFLGYLNEGHLVFNIQFCLRNLCSVNASRLDKLLF